MRIGLDVDGVLLDLHSFKYTRGLDFFGFDKLKNKDWKYKKNMV